MEDNEFFPEWFKRRFRSPLTNWFDDFDKNFEEMLRGLELPKDIVRERKLPDGGTVREFGNVKPSLKGGPFGTAKPSLDVKEEREPLVDAMVQSDTVKVVAELPGVEKSDIALECDGRNLVLKVDTDKRRFYKSLELPVEVDPDTSKASYKNGVLELVLTRKTPGNKPKQIKID